MQLQLLATTCLALAASAPTPDKNSRVEHENILGDSYVRVDKVELPAVGLDPQNLSLVLLETIDSCRKLEKPQVERNQQFIRIVPRSSKIEGCRAPASKNQGRKQEQQVIALGTLPRGTYRVRVITADDVTYKILNVY